MLSSPASLSHPHNQRPQTPRLSTQQPPEDFYRSRSSLSLTDPNQDNSPPSVSPADSQAPIMASAWKAPSADSDDHPRSEQQQQPQQQPIPEISVLPQQPEATYFAAPPLKPLTTNYRSSSFAAVNGEVSGTNINVNGEVTGVPSGPSGTPTEQFARYPIAPLSAGLKTSGTTAEEIKLAELEEKAQQEDRKDLVRNPPPP